MLKEVKTGMQEIINNLTEEPCPSIQNTYNYSNYDHYNILDSFPDTNAVLPFNNTLAVEQACSEGSFFY